MSGISPLIDPSLIQTWIVCESDQRWMTASRRFATHLVPAPMTVNLVSAEPNLVRRLLIGKRKAVVLWEIDGSCAARMYDLVASTSLGAPGILQIVAANGITPRDQMALTELGVGAIISQPEQLPGLSNLCLRYFK
ncbi:hypothetical protein [Planctomycetes bacterium K23_9]|uniref:Response regulatory domain-containing protein n=1 Tax=Stieleria marina TaxID=1930275 RepID=A0A517NLY1_9BACT|nr:hypothetical protein K239x_00180 [Planctomycetes bacterium K23_9]